MAVSAEMRRRRSCSRIARDLRNARRDTLGRGGPSRQAGTCARALSCWPNSSSMKAAARLNGQGQ
eukprot:scaffold78111_cov60-Phaeocystis_antarctica.AAC.2